VTRINSETARVLTMSDVKSSLLVQGLEVTSGTPDQFGNDIKREIAKITRIAKTAGVKAE
jgi:tripartite-type tricarboxylate transporter receptor subunit TctC